MKDIILALTSLFASLVIVILIVVVGWLIVWKAFLSRFKFIRELVSANESEDKAKRTEADEAAKTRSPPRRTRFKDD